MWMMLSRIVLGSISLESSVKTLTLERIFFIVQEENKIMSPASGDGPSPDF